MTNRWRSPPLSVDEPATGERVEIEAVEHRRRHRPVVLGLRAEVPDVRRPAEEDVLESGHVVGHQWLLWHVGDERGPTRPGPQGERGSVDRDLPVVSHDADDRPQQ